MNQGLVTVVIPVYNVEQQLDRCVNSVVNQTYQNLEIILVDDGSPDRCPEMCEQWARKDPRIRVIHKENAGLGMARNTGIDNAHGAYICFFDSDDYVAPDTIEKTFRLAEKEGADIVVFGFSRVRKDGLIVGTFTPRTEKTLYEGQEILAEFLPDWIGPDTFAGKETNLWMSVWGSLFSMRLIQRTNWRLVSERVIISEDIYSLLRLCKNVEKVAVLPEAFYFYCENAASLTHAFRKDRYERIKIFYDECIKVCDEFGYDEKIRDRLSYPFLSNTIAALKMIACANYSRREKKEAILAILKDRKLQEVVSNMDIKYEKKARKALILAMKYRLYGVARWMIMAKARDLGK